MEMENFWKKLEDYGSFLYNHLSHDFKIRKGLLLWTRSNKFTPESSTGRFFFTANGIITKPWRIWRDAGLTSWRPQRDFRRAW